MARSSVLRVGMPHQGVWVMPMALADLVAHSLECLSAFNEGIESSRHRLACQIDQEVTYEGKEFDQVSVAIDDGVLEPGPDAPNRVRRLVVGHFNAPCLASPILGWEVLSTQGLQ